MAKKQTKGIVAERLLYLLTVGLLPSTPLFFLYSQNVSEGLAFTHFLLFGGILAAISLILYLLISLLALRRRRTVLLLILFWGIFWFFRFFRDLLARGNAGLSETRVLVYLLVFLCMIGFVLRYIKVSRALTNSIAVWLCLLFAFNFIPQAMNYVSYQRVRVESTKDFPFELKSDFHVDPSLPHPNVYWLHMDGMMGFDAVEHYFGDPQTELKSELAARGFVVNETARLEAGATLEAVPALTSPDFYDNFLADEFAKVARLTRFSRSDALYKAMTGKGISISDDVIPQLEILKAFSAAGYINIANKVLPSSPMGVDMLIGDNAIIKDFGAFREDEARFGKVADFVNLVTDASALSAVKAQVAEALERARPAGEPFPEYPETISRYITEYSDSNGELSKILRAMEHMASLPSPHFLYYSNSTAHCNDLTTLTKMGEITYERTIGRTFIFDENGNIHKERLDDPNDVRLYLPQHKYTVKQLLAQLDIILKNDPDAVIVVQGDHGLHGIGIESPYYNADFMFERGYDLEDQLNLNLSVISAVRIPPRYGALSQSLDPLDLARYLVNHFVGGGNYDYLYYAEEE